jgi:succinate dehydrogenase / fumarate reductase cytochrome b subunit
MALTGIFLITFLLVHVALNACIFNDLSWFNANDDGSMFNRAAFFMGNSIIIRIMEIGLFAGILLHAIQGYAIEMKNRSRRKQGYEVGLGNRGSKWYSRSMAILGTLILLYLIIHIKQFWWPSRITGAGVTEYAPVNHTVEVHDMFRLMYDTFQELWVVILYLAAVAALAFHLFHGFHSAFRSLGVHNKKYLALLRTLGYGYTVIVCLLFAFMPIAMYFHWVAPSPI